MRKLVEEQLRKCKYADLSNFDTKTNSCIIPKLVKAVFRENNSYIVKLSNIMMSDKSIYASNWNHNTVPPSSCLKIYVEKYMGRMLKVESIVYDYENKKDIIRTWSGWLCVDEITMLEKI